MDSSPFAAKVGKVLQKVALDLLQLRKSETDVAQQPDAIQVAKQFKPRMRSDANRMDRRRAVVVWIDHNARALEDGMNGRHGQG
jgi:hypothetical protein